MLSEMGVRPMIGGGGGDGFGGEELGKELEVLLREQRRQEASDRERELSLYRSGSAPPTVEGSLAAVGGLFGAAGGGGASDFKNGNGFLSEEELRSDPAYLSYYYSHVNLNPRLPPPILSKEDWRFAQRLHAGSSALGGIGDRRKPSEAEEGGSRSLFSKQPGFSLHKEESEVEPRKAPGSGDWMDKGGDGLIGLSGITLGRQKSFAEILQDDLGRTTPISTHPSRPTSRNAFDNGVEQIGSSETLRGLHTDAGSLDGLRPGGNIQNVAGVPHIGTSGSQTFASVLSSSLSRSNTPDPQLVARAPSPCLPPVGTRPGATDKRTNGSCSFNAVSSGIIESDDLVAALAGMNLSSAGEIDEHNITHSKLPQDIDGQHNYIFDSQGDQSHMKQHSFLKNSEPGYLDMPSITHSAKRSYPDLVKGTGELVDFNASLRPDAQVDLQRSTHSSPNSFLKAPSGPLVGSPGGSPAHFLSGDGANGTFTGFGPGGYSLDPALTSMMGNQIGTGNLPLLFENAVTASGIASPTVGARAVGGFSSGPNLTGATGLQNLNRIADSTAAASLQMHLLDPLYIQYMRNAEYAAQAAANFSDPSMERGYIGNSYVDLLGVQKAYLGSLLQPHKQFDLPFLGKSGALNHGYYGNPAFGLGMSYPGNPLANSVLPATAGPGSPLRHGERNVRLPSGMRNFAGGIMGPWHSDISGNMDGSLASSLLDEFKNNKTKCYELSDIASHVVEFSADQFGSRFIQQKLETATTEEKNMVFEEIMPQALTLMTDVFGNYVIQKFFDHGTAAQIRELADQLIGHVLTLSLQMYGCRVIQKAIEVVDLDQKTKMVTELDGHVMRCVRDQNGNHVIQKCIECIPQDGIQFIITSFYGQVVTLSTHPYGCRVIQRVLEHCDDPKTQQIVMDEIMQCVCMLAQDQYGNYVVQHVLEHGKPHERSAIIEKLAGQIVQMSQQKFASNVVEKCLTFGDPAERQLLVNEMLGSTDENEPLQAMMKDQFANYVVQKVLETCDDQQRELILSRIKVHLSALKKYTYGKHIVARVEKLVAAGERRIGVQSSYTS